MTVDEKLLWKAYPEGYLAIRGIKSFIGDTYVGDGIWIDVSKTSSPVAVVLPFEWKFSENIQAGEEDTQACLEHGYYLPNVDPADKATWACLLEDLAQALEWDTPAWGWEQWPDDELWVLHGPDEKTHVFLDLNTNDPGTALVLARASIRVEDL